MAEGVGDFFGHFSVYAAAAGKADIAAQATCVRIEGHNQVGRFETLPDAEIDGVGAACNPAKEQVEAFAGAAVCGVGKKVAQASFDIGANSAGAYGLDKVACAAEVRGCVALEIGVFEAAVSFELVGDSGQEIGDVGASGHAINKTFKQHGEIGVIDFAQKLRRARAQVGEDLGGCAFEEFNAAVCQATCEEGDDFLIFRSVIVPDKVDRIVCAALE